MPNNGCEHFSHLNDPREQPEDLLQFQILRSIIANLLISQVRINDINITSLSNDKK